MTEHTSPVMRNALWLIGAQVLAAPVSILVTAVIARYLGPSEFGALYLATTYAGFAFLFVEWGQFGSLTGKIAADRSRAGELLGSAMVWRLCSGAVIGGAVLGVCALAGYGRLFLWIEALIFAAAILGTVADAGQDAVRGFERTDFAALCSLGGKLLGAAVSVLALVLGFGVLGLLSGQILCAVVGTAFVLYMLPRLQIPRLHVRAVAIRELVHDGSPFLVFVLVVQLQSLVDGAMMSHFASAESLGWYAASCKVIGILSLPATAIGSALYPTLVNQFSTDPTRVPATVQGALRVLILAVFPLSLGCVLFPQLGIVIFNPHTYAPAEQNVRVLGLWLFLLYFTIPLSQCINARGRQGRWAAVQFGCVIVSAVADPLLIAWFQEHYGNGGLGVCVAVVGSEVLMIFGAIVLAPKGVLNWSLLGLFGKPALAGMLMVAIGLGLGRYNDWLAAALSVAGYVAALWFLGVLRGTQLRALINTVRARTV